MHASVRAGRPYNTEPTAAPTGGHPISIVVADDTTFVEHLGNAGRPFRRHQPTNTKTLTSRAPTGNAVAGRLGIADSTVRKWRRRFCEQRLDGHRQDVGGEAGRRDALVDVVDG